MGRRYFYAIVDETHAQIERRNRPSHSTWDGYEANSWYQRARERSGRKPMRAG